MELPAWKNPPVLNALFFFVLETFAPSSVRFLGWPLVPFLQNFMGISVFFDYHTELKKPQITSKTLRKNCGELF